MISTWILVGSILILLILFVYILVKVSQDNQAASLNLKAAEPVLKSGPTASAKKKRKGGR